MNTLELQRALWRLGYDVGGCDGVDGPKTQRAIASFMHDDNASAATPGYELALALQTHLDHLVPPFIPAAHFTPANRPHSAPIDLIVIHTMEAPEKPKTARNVATWFAGPSAPQASAHYCIDDQEVILCVLECDVAWHAPGVNSRGIGLEHAGYASQTPEEWSDDYSNAVLERSARLAAGLARRFRIPIVKLSVGELAAGGRGFIGHVDATNAFSGGRGHSDPGPSFPYERYLELVRNVADT